MSPDVEKAPSFSEHKMVGWKEDVMVAGSGFKDAGSFPFHRERPPGALPKAQELKSCMLLTRVLSSAPHMVPEHHLE